jgi:hypothetical protein
MTWKRPTYEATFVDQDGKGVDVMFGDADVERLDDLVEVPFRERLMQIRQSLFPEQRVSGLESDE